MFTPLEGLSVVVTGGTRGIGRGIASAFVKSGANTLITGRNQDIASQTATELTYLGKGNCKYFIGDISDPVVAKELAKFACKNHGGIDVLCANAGIFPEKAIPDLTEEDIDNILGTNLKGTIFSVQACLPALSKSGRGRIIMTSSITGPITGFPGWSHYGASKAAQLGFLRTAALELAGKGITVNAILPGSVLTEGLEALGEEFLKDTAASIPLGRLGTVTDIATAALFFATMEAGFITGQTLVVDGGQVLPESPAALNVST